MNCSTLLPPQSLPPRIRTDTQKETTKKKVKLVNLFTLLKCSLLSSMTFPGHLQPKLLCSYMRWCCSLFSQLPPPMEAGNSLEQKGSIRCQVQFTYKDGTARPSHKKTVHSIPKLINVQGEKN